MEKMHLLIVLHGHQPVGNFDKVFAKAVSLCYRPVLDILMSYPEFHCGLHLSGPLLSWLERHDRELLDQAAELAARGQVEMLTGGFYEPHLAVIPQEDAQAQINMQTGFLRRRFGVEPAGFWLAERIWEPSLPAKIAAAGLKYTLIDDTHLYYAGLDERDMFGYHLTEREGHALALFPTHKDLRYTIPFQEPAATIDFLRRAYESVGPSCATYGDDLEKFGLWPRTYRWVIEKGWLKRFLEAVLKEDSWLVSGTPAAYLAERPPVGRAYLPTASYEEMLSWALPAAAGQELTAITHELKERGEYERLRRFLRGGVWENFLVKYRESNLMHKRMLHISNRLRRRQVGGQALDHLLQAQCNCAYWHGLFGGLYLGHLRQAVHQHLIAAESLLDKAARGEGPWARSTVEDLDIDGHQEVLLANQDLDVVVHPAYGGSVSMVNLRRQEANIADVLTRRPEAYHALFQGPHQAPPPEEADEDAIASAHDLVIFKEENLQEYLVYDWYHRACFQDHLLPPGAELASFVRADFHEQGDFVNQPFRLLEQGTQAGAAFCAMTREGNLWAPGGPWPLTIDKRLALGPGPRLACAWSLVAARADTPPLAFAVELNLTLFSHDDPGRFLRVGGEGPLGQRLDLAQRHEMEEVSLLELVNDSQGWRVRLTPSRPARLWAWSVETVSQSEGGLERTYQGTSLVLIFDLHGGSGQHRLDLALEVAE
jgi:alpha-amylase